jgi:hypothetical protein
MKLFFSILWVSAGMLAAPADNPSLAGKWKVHNDISGNESDMSCTLTQTDNDLKGACVSEQGTVNITGKVDGKNVGWVYKSEYNGGPITLTYKGTLASPNKISGTVTVEEYSVEGDFTATPAN